MSVSGLVARTVDINRGIRRDNLGQLFAFADSDAHTFRIEVLADGEPADLSGYTAVGYFNAPQGATIPIPGTIAGNVVTVTLTAVCYATAGHFDFTVQVADDDTSKVTVYWCDGVVRVEQSDTIIDPGTIIQSVTQLITDIEDAIESVPPNLTKLQAATAPTYSNASTYAVGDYAWYSGELKRCIVPITTPESWTAAHWTAAAVGNDLAVKIAETESGIVINL